MNTGSTDLFPRVVDRLDAMALHVARSGLLHELSPSTMTPVSTTKESAHMSLDVSLEEDSREVYGANITHNLNRMAEAAGLYTPLWRPEDLGITRASELMVPLRTGLIRLVEQPTYFETFNDPNGWGKYEHFVVFVAKYLEACGAHPDAFVRASR